jgi:hypothetical protein
MTKPLAVLSAFLIALSIQAAEPRSTFRITLPTNSHARTVQGIHYKGVEMTNRQQRLILAVQIDSYLNILDEKIPVLDATDRQWLTNEMRRTSSLPWREQQAYNSNRLTKIWMTRMHLELLQSYSSSLVAGKGSVVLGKTYPYSERDEMGNWLSFSTELLTSDLLSRMAELKIDVPRIEVNRTPRYDYEPLAEFGFLASLLVAEFIETHADDSATH